jgi:transposase
MGRAIELREGVTTEQLRSEALAAQNVRQARRLLALLAVAEGKSRERAANAGGMDRQTLRDWVYRYNEFGAVGLISKKSPGRPAKLSAEQKEEITKIVDAGPYLEKDNIVRWRCVDLKYIIRDRFDIDFHVDSIGRLLHGLRFSHISARPRHPKQKPEAIEDFKKQLNDVVKGLLKDKGIDLNTPVEFWFQDEMRVGQKSRRVRIWARKGSRPRQPADQRYQSVYVFGAVCPGRDIGAALIMPRVNADGMQKHLEEISRHVTPGAHAVVIIDGAGWHTAKNLVVPSNISLLKLPPYCPELNPQENIWQYLRDNYLSRLVLLDYDAIVEVCDSAWNKLIAETGRIRSIATREWAVFAVS